MNPKWVVPGGIALLAAGIGVAAVLRRPTVAPPPGPEAVERGSGTTSPAPVKPASKPKTSGPSAPAAFPEEVRSWEEAVLSKDPARRDHALHRLKQVDDVQRAQVMRLAKEAREPEVRKATIDYLASHARPPAEEFFIEVLDADGHDGPREVAARALETLGTEKALEVLDQVMEDERTPQALRGRAARAALHIRRRLKRGE